MNKATRHRSLQWVLLYAQKSIVQYDHDVYVRKNQHTAINFELQKLIALQHQPACYAMERVRGVPELVPVQFL